MSQKSRYGSVLNVCMSPDLKRQIEQEALDRQTTPSQLAREAIANAFLGAANSEKRSTASKEGTCHA